MSRMQRKIIISILLMIILISGFNNAFAFEIGAKELISLGECERLMTYNGVPIRTTYIVYEKDGATTAGSSSPGR